MNSNIARLRSFFRFHRFQNFFPFIHVRFSLRAQTFFKKIQLLLLCKIKSIFDKEIFV